MDPVRASHDQAARAVGNTAQIRPFPPVISATRQPSAFRAPHATTQAGCIIFRVRTRFSIVALATAVTLTATGCGSDTSSSPSVATTTAVAAPTAAPTPAAPPDAKTVLAALTAAKVGLSGGAVQTEDTDPNDLLGRPNGYLSRASADMPGGDRDGDKYGIERGLVIEVFPTAADADRRSTFIQDTLKSMQILGTEYHYRAGGGAVLVRVSGKVKPSVAKKVEAAVATL